MAGNETANRPDLSGFTRRAMRVNRLLALSMGDPAGVGPEVCLRAALSPEVRSACVPVLVGERWSIERAGDAIGIRPEIRSVEVTEEGVSAGNEEEEDAAIFLLETDASAGAGVRWGEESADAGRAGLAAIVTAARLAMAGWVDGMVTAPVHKTALWMAGCPHPGHTELLAELTGARDSRMLLVAEGLRVAHNSTHVSLRRACEMATSDRIVRSIELLADGLGRLGLRPARIAVCGLNPHAGEGGRFGEEEEREIRPAIARARESGIDASGPFPADTIFARALAGEFDGVLAMTHDQGHIPVKTLGFHADPAGGGWTSVRGVNVSLGLPIVRTSVDHGTAFDIAGKGIARADSMIDAVLLAVKLSEPYHPR